MPDTPRVAYTQQLINASKDTQVAEQHEHAQTIERNREYLS